MSYFLLGWAVPAGAFTVRGQSAFSQFVIFPLGFIKEKKKAFDMRSRLEGMLTNHMLN